MTGLIILAGIIVIIYNLAKDASIKQIPLNSDIQRANQDYYSGKCSAKEMNKRLQNGYYVRKDK